MSIDDAVLAIAAARDDELAVLTMSGLGLWPSLRPEDYRLVGLMGSAAAIGLGIAVGDPDRGVWVIDGDGSLAMQLGVLTAVGEASPPRFVHNLLVNGVYAISGGQPVPSRPDWEALALGAGYAWGERCATPSAIASCLAAARPGPGMVVVECDARRGQFAPGVFAVDASQEATRVRAAIEAPK
jgi:thiamine pyrophosphate-dependent acetolactate synthase large subunit-like protein